jgi:hypothetical protein
VAAAVAAAHVATDIQSQSALAGFARRRDLPCRGLARASRDDGMSDYEFTMSLRIRHPGIDPALITQTLGLEPEHCWRAGDDRKSSAGDSLNGRYRESYWVCGLVPDPKLSTKLVGVESELQQALGKLRRSFDFLQSLHESGGTLEVQISIFAREEFRIDLLAEVSSLLGRLGITMAIEVKPYSTSASMEPAR